MSIYDRDYYREEKKWNRPAHVNRRPVSIVFILISVNIVLFLLNAFLFPSTNSLTSALYMTGDTLASPSQWYRLLTYGFVHSPQDLMHIVGNMIALGFFGRAIEQKYGHREFLFFYLTAVFCGGLLWGILNFNHEIPMLGASGAITAILILFAINFPNVTVLLFFFLPIPAWLLGIGYILYDLLGASSGKGNIAHEVHLAGAAFAVAYYFGKIRLDRYYSLLWPGSFFKKLSQKIREKKLRVRCENILSQNTAEKTKKTDPLDDEVDQILRKINTDGWASLSQQEHDLLLRASEKKRQKK